ncbi:arsenite efflux MFS transporter ArsK [Undibacter mobilis]|uniref:MFS transporter n=1 Tax=Undibacter mobilis TaxID=2292256 RepID=A0A371B2V3_9BRAD|nr:arsenite efflux MFS transporter ArsK [Undibacter mobilis]RDV01880.1 MFS transporter [Undibacter mobilis]
MRLWAEIAALGVTQIIGYGTLYYSFSILEPSISRDFGWSSEWMFGAFSGALLIGGLVAPLTGRAIDRFGAGRVMAGGSLVAALALVGCALAPSGAAFVPALFAIEIASTLVQYGAAFSLLVQRHHDRAQRSIVYLTLIAGFASTMFWPLTTWLHHVLTWQQVYLIFAASHLILCLPIHAWLSRPVADASPKEEEVRAEASGAIQSADGLLLPAARRKGLVLTAGAFAFESFISSAILVHMLPMLQALGLGLAGVVVSTVFGPSQVASRFINMVFGKGISQLTLAIISAALLPGALIVLSASAPSLVGAVLFAILFGMGSGLYSIVGGTLPLELFGRRGYGTLQGQITSVRLIVGSAAPFAFAVMMDRTSPAGAVVMSAVLGSGAVLMLLAIKRLMSEPSPDV